MILWGAHASAVIRLNPLQMILKNFTEMEKKLNRRKEKTSSRKQSPHNQTITYSW